MNAVDQASYKVTGEDEMKKWEEFYTGIMYSGYCAGAAKIAAAGTAAAVAIMSAAYWKIVNNFRC